MTQKELDQAALDLSEHLSKVRHAEAALNSSNVQLRNFRNNLAEKLIPKNHPAEYRWMYPVDGGMVLMAWMEKEEAWPFGVDVMNGPSVSYKPRVEFQQK